MSTRRSPVEGGPAVETRRRLLETAQRAFTAKGFAATSVSSDVLRPSGVSVGSFYHQFADKAELFVAVVEEASTAAQRSIARSHDRPATTDITELAEDAWSRLLAMVDAHEDLFQIVRRERRNPDPAIAPAIARVQERWVSTLADAYRSLAGTPDDFPAGAAAELVAALGGGIVDAYLDLTADERAARRRDLASDLAAFSVAGVDGLARRRRGDASTPRSRRRS